MARGVQSMSDSVGTLVKSIRFTPELWARIVERAKASNISPSKAIRLFIERGLKEVEG